MDDEPTPPADPPPDLELRRRVDALERSLAHQADEIRTRRLVVVGPDGDERIATDVGEQFAELRLGIGGRRRRLDVVLVAAREPPDARGTTIAGLEVWLDGDHVGGLTISPER